MRSSECSSSLLHSAQFVTAREELFFMLCAATISWWQAVSPVTAYCSRHSCGSAAQSGSQSWLAPALSRSLVAPPCRNFEMAY